MRVTHTARGPRAEVLLIAHGSPDPGSREELRALRSLVAARLAEGERRLPSTRGREIEVALGVLEFPGPDLPPVGAALAALASRGPVVAQPLLLFDGLHAHHDLPRLTADACRLGLQVQVGGPFGWEPALLDLAVERVAAAAPGPDDLLLFVGRGSSDPQAREETEEVAALVASRLGLEHLVCYTGISPPLLADGARLALARRPRRLLALPYLLHRGVLTRRVSEVLGPAAERGRTPLAVLPHLGNAPQVVETVASRVEALMAGGPGGGGG
ncbi:MAG TPA: CbiX/SirB N-terminal domain-containing protein [Candidatus Dormibacteraeota bacterium]|nr:CbiX/SirB N-terminal domain-containing protein [Candidatus Dormibacteraeota bacterium]